MSLSNPRLGVFTGTLLIVANMIGVGVFTTTGYMVAAIPSPPAVLAAWLVGGVAAFCGALCYAELGAALPRNGGEYQLLSRIYHPAVGFVAGVISPVVGFAAPLALYALVFGKYLQTVFLSVRPIPAGLLLIGLFVVVHSLNVKVGSRFHNALTLGKIGLIVLFVAAGLVFGDLARLCDSSQVAVGDAIFSSPFAVQLVYVSFSNSGWNAAAYIAGEFRRPEHDLPRSILAGTAIVTLLYLGLNAAFLAAAPLEDLAGKEEVGHVAAVHLFGERGGKFASLLIVAGLVSTVSANLMAGPRVLEALGVDWPILQLLTKRIAGGGPLVAIGLQGTLAAAMLVSASFQTLLTFIGVTLSLSALVTAIGVIVLRLREPDLPRPYRLWGYPFTPLLFALLEGWMIVFALREEPRTALATGATLMMAFVLYGLMRWTRRTA